MTLRHGLWVLSMLGFASMAIAQSNFDGKWTADVVRPAPAGNQTLAIGDMGVSDVVPTLSHRTRKQVFRYPFDRTSRKIERSVATRRSPAARLRPR